MAKKTDDAERSGALASGPTEVISATVPRSIVREARQRTGKREFSAFVSRAMHNELVRENQRELIDALIAQSGPLNEDHVRSLEHLFGRRKK